MLSASGSGARVQAWQQRTSNAEMAPSRLSLSRVVPLNVLAAAESQSRESIRVQPQPAEAEEEEADNIVGHGAPIMQLSLTLSPFALRAWWCWVFTFQFFEAAYCVGMGMLYSQVFQRDSLLWFLDYYFLFSQSSTFVHKHAHMTAVTFFTFGAFFGYCCLEMLWFSLSYRRLSYARRRIRNWTLPGPVRRSKLIARMRWVIESAITIWDSFGIRGRYFRAGLVMRELLEISLQTTQAYASSRRISNFYLNQCYGILMFTNCWGGAFLHRWYHHDIARQRLAYVMMDMTLDFVWGVILPLWTFLPYLRMRFEPGYIKNVEWDSPENTAEEIEQILIVTYTNYVLAVFPFISVLGSLRGMKKVLQAAKHAAVEPTKKHFLKKMEQSRTQVNRDILNHPQTALWASFVGHYVAVRLPRQHIFHAFLKLYGLGILFTSMAAGELFDNRANNSLFQCMHRVHPWFSVKFACVGRRINCTLAGIEGNRTELTPILTSFDERSLANLIITDCQRLDIPPEIQRFYRLRTLDIESSLLRSWELDAAITDAFLAIQTIKLTTVQLDGPPRGLTSVMLPQTLEWIRINNVDFDEAVRTIEQNWKHLKYFYCDYCYLTEVPRAIAYMTELLQLSMCDNNITTFPDDRVTTSLLSSFWIEQNELLPSLPDTIWRSMAQMVDMSIQHTNISRMPAYAWNMAQTNPQLTLYAFATPLCENGTDAQAAGLPIGTTCEDLPQA